MAGEGRNLSQDLDYLREPFATVHVAVENAPFYSKPDAATQPIWRMAWVNSLYVDGSRLASAPSGWIPIKALGHVKGQKGDLPEGWVRRRDVVLPRDFKKVMACWPIKSIFYVGGDYAAEVKFKRNGNASVKEIGDDHRFNKKPARPAKVYMAGDIVAIEAVKQGRSRFFMSGYRRAERRLYPEGVAATEQESFPDSAMKDCEVIPMLKE
jgi:hypothetical protein